MATGRALLRIIDVDDIDGSGVIGNDSSDLSSASKSSSSSSLSEYEMPMSFRDGKDKAKETRPEIAKAGSNLSFNSKASNASSVVRKQRIKELEEQLRQSTNDSNRQRMTRKPELKNKAVGSEDGKEAAAAADAVSGNGTAETPAAGANGTTMPSQVVPEAPATTTTVPAVPAPKKYLNVNGMMKLNPEYKKWKETHGGGMSIVCEGATEMSSAFMVFEEGSAPLLGNTATSSSSYFSNENTDTHTHVRFSDVNPADAAAEDQAEQERLLEEKLQKMYGRGDPETKSYDDFDSDDGIDQRIMNSLRKSCGIEDDEESESHTGKSRRLSSFMVKMKSKLFAKPDETKEKCLPHDSFSFMIMAKTCTSSFVAAIAIFTLQMVVFILLLLDLAAAGEPGNAFGVPANVSAQLRCTQFIAVLVSVITQQDLRTSLTLFRDGFTKDFDTVFLETSPWKYHMSIVARAVSGSIGLLVTFVLVITAPSVVDLLLNFTGTVF